MLQFIRRRHPKEKVESLLASAGFRQATPLQEEYVPTALQGKDLIVESEAGEGKTFAQILSYLLQPRPKKKGPAILILVDSVKAAEKFEAEFNRLPKIKTKTKSAAFLGKEGQVKNELRSLARRPGLIVGTSQRVIDHIRRNNIHFSDETKVIINLPEASDHSEFYLDVEFILAKMPHKTQTILFTAPGTQEETFTQLLKRPTVLFSAERNKDLPLLNVYTQAKRSPSTLRQLIFGLNVHNPLILCASKAEAQSLKAALQKQGLSCSVLNGELSEEAGSTSTLNECNITTFKGATRIAQTYDSILFFGLPSSMEVFEEIGWSFAGRSPAPYFALLVSDEESETLNNLQENIKMKKEKQDFPEEKEVLIGKLKNIMQLIKQDEDPEVLNSYKKLIKRNVPLHLRAYVSAYLFKQLMEGKSGGPIAGKNKSQEDNMQTIFVSIGKNRKVFPRDLVRLFRKSLDLKSEQIGNIKVLDNYSFVDIPQNVAQKAIETMDGIEFRGRNITVNFARKKKGDNNK